MITEDPYLAPAALQTVLDGIADFRLAISLLGEGCASWAGPGGLGVVDAEKREAMLAEPSLDRRVGGLLDVGGEDRAVLQEVAEQGGAFGGAADRVDDLGQAGGCGLDDEEVGVVALVQFRRDAQRVQVVATTWAWRTISPRIVRLSWISRLTSSSSR